MQNLPDKGVSGSLYYLRANSTVTGLTGMVLEVKVERREAEKRFPFWVSAFDEANCCTFVAKFPVPIRPRSDG